MSSKKLYPPWYDIAALLYYTIGQDPGVSILEPECEEIGVYHITLCVDYRQKAEYLRAIIPVTYTSFNTIIMTHIIVNDEKVDCTCISQKNQKDVANIFCNALRTNPLFIGVALVPQPFIPISSEIIVNIIEERLQPLSCGMYSRGVSVADAFAEVCKHCYGNIIQTTALFESHKRCRGSQNCYYCVGDYID